MYAHLQNKARTTPPVNLTTLRKMKSEQQAFSSLTAYDASFASLVDEAGVDVVLVGDSLGMVIQGHDTTVPVTMDDIVYHTRAVAKGLHRAFLISDMPFMSYSSRKQALDNAARLMQEAGAMMVKLEGGARQLKIVEHLANADIPVCGHIGLTPQSVHKIGGFRVQGREDTAARQMLADAIALQQAGADIIVLECIPSELAREVTASVEVPVIGIGAGPHVDGQILVLYDVLNITPGRKPRFAKNFMNGQTDILAALQTYVRDVADRTYPAPEHCFSA